MYEIMYGYKGFGYEVKESLVINVLQNETFICIWKDDMHIQYII